LTRIRSSSLDLFQPAVREWFTSAFPSPTTPQRLGWPAIARGESTLMLAPTGSGKTLAAFLWCLNRLMFSPAPPLKSRCRVLYISPLKALAVDVERNLRVPLTGIASIAHAQGASVTVPEIAIRTGDTPALDRARFGREAADILITTPESLFLLLTSNARARLLTVDTVIIDEIHALVPGKRGAHLVLSLERLEALRPAGSPPLQRIGLSATQRPLDEVARFLGGARSPTPVKAKRGTHRRRLRTTTATAVETELRDELATPRGTILPPDDRERGREEDAVASRRGAGRRHGAPGRADRAAERTSVPGTGPTLDLDLRPPAAAGTDSRASIHAPVRQQPPTGRTAGRGSQRSRR
jgi:ATP-dependent Lhr-like helicase